MADPGTVPDPRPILVVDFDGTVYRGDAPVWFYAERIAEKLPSAYLDAVESYLKLGARAGDGYGDSETARVLHAAEDAWGATQNLAKQVYGVDDATTQRAFLASRMYMLSDQCDVEPVEPLTALLAELAAEVRVVLATNSPAEGLAPLLDRIGVAGLFAEVVPDARKPVGLRHWMNHTLGDRPASQLFSLGDHYRNEIEPAMSIGASAGYIDRFGRADGPATATAPRVEDLLPAITAWAEDSTRKTLGSEHISTWQQSSSGAGSASSAPARS